MRALTSRGDFEELLTPSIKDKVKEKRMTGYAVRSGFVVVKCIGCEDFVVDWAPTEQEAEKKAQLYIKEVQHEVEVE